MDTQMIEAAASALKEADAVVFATGAGMGVDSGLPDFRGNEGFWRAYPMLGQKGVNFAAMANPVWFVREPEVAWGFYGHRLELYRDSLPHEGFQAVRRLREALGFEMFCYTSNVDGHLQVAGFGEDEVVECHGSIRHLQCVRACHADVWPAAEVSIDVDVEELRATNELPRCPKCNGHARPAILMFGDSSWVEKRTSEQFERYTEFLQKNLSSKLVVLEVGAGTRVPNVRYQAERLSSVTGGALIRINPREAEGPNGTISISSGGKDALLAIEQAVLNG